MTDGLIEKTFEWTLRSSPAALWPVLADTARLNEALGLPLYRINETFDAQNRRRRYGEMQENGKLVRWEEPPFEWTENRWWRWRRFYEEGPFRETGGMMLLAPDAAGGTQMTYRIGAEPNGMLGRMLIASGHLKAAAQALEAIAHQADAHVQKPAGDFFANLAASRMPRPRVPDIPCATGDPGDAELLRQLGSWLTVAPLADVSEIRPIRLARALGLTVPEAIRVCLLGVSGGALQRRYAAICPICRSGTVDAASLADLQSTLACAYCGSGYARDFAGNVETLFAADAAIRPDPGGVYCGSGPRLAPHRLFQQNVDGMERREIEMTIPAGTYQVRAVDGPLTMPFELGASAGLYVVLTDTALTAEEADSADGVVIENRCNHVHTVALERCEWRLGALPVADLLMDQGFREQAPDEKLAEGDTAPAGSGAILALAVPVPPAEDILSVARDRGGALYAADDEAWMMVFPGAEAAVRAARDLLRVFPEARQGLDYGPLTAAATGGGFGYIGETTETARALAASAQAGGVRRSPRITEALSASAPSTENGLSGDDPGVSS